MNDYGLAFIRDGHPTKAYGARPDQNTHPQKAPFHEITNTSDVLSSAGINWKVPSRLLFHIIAVFFEKVEISGQIRQKKREKPSKPTTN